MLNNLKLLEIMTRRKYTPEEEQIIAQEISSHQTNIKQGLLIASERLGRSLSSVRNHWYTIQSKREPVFCVFSDFEVVRNRKVAKYTTCDSKTDAPVGLFKRILRWLGLWKKKL